MTLLKVHKLCVYALICSCTVMTFCNYAGNEVFPFVLLFSGLIVLKNRGFEGFLVRGILVAYGWLVVCCLDNHLKQ